ncbi:ash family protein [Salmonella enterica]|nr:ash family protein [Salmonella enterica]
MTTYKNRLPPSALMGYISPAPHKTGAGISPLLITLAHNRASGFFTCDALPHLFRIMVGCAGPLSGGPGSSVTGRANPVHLTTPRLALLSGELSQLTLEAISWQTVNNASAAIRSHASTPKPKSTADCAAPTKSRSSCTSTCCTNAIATLHQGISPLFSAICLMICASYKSSPTSQRTPSKKPNRLPLLFAAGGLRTSVVREILL